MKLYSSYGSVESKYALFFSYDYNHILTKSCSHFSSALEKKMIFKRSLFLDKNVVIKLYLLTILYSFQKRLLWIGLNLPHYLNHK